MIQLSSIISYICLTGLFLPLVLLYSNRGYRSANRYLAGFLFFASYYLLSSFYFFFGKSLAFLAIFSATGSFFYLIGPFAFIYVRSILKDSVALRKIDYLHFVPFAASLLGFIPYWLSPWDFKIAVAENILSEQWDMASFNLNALIPHKMDQALNVLHTYYYAIGLWYLVWLYKKDSQNPIIHNAQYAMVRRWLILLTAIYSIIALNFAVTMVFLWLYDDKSLFLEKAKFALLFASAIYISMNMLLMFFPQILYGIPVGGVPASSDFLQPKSSTPLNPNTASTSRSLQSDSRYDADGNRDPQLFTDDYVFAIEAAMQRCMDRKSFLNPDFKLESISSELGIPSHHLTYFFNNQKGMYFTEWRDQLRVGHSMELMRQGESAMLSMEGIAKSSGFTAQSTFLRVFKQVTGKTPSQFLAEEKGAS